MEEPAALSLDPKTTTPEILAVHLLLGQLKQLGEADADTMLELLEKRLPDIYDDMDLDVALRLTETPQGQRDMATQLLLHALGLKQDSILANRPKLLARRYLSTRNTSMDPETTMTTMRNSDKRKRQTLAEKREMERQRLIQNPERLPACRRRVPPIFQPGVHYRIVRVADDVMPGLKDAGLVALVHADVWRALIRNVGRTDQVADDTAPPVIELVTWAQNGNISERVLVRPYGAHDRPDTTLLLTNQRTMNQLKRPYKHITVQLCYRMPNVGFITLRFYGTQQDQDKLDTPQMSGDSLVKTTAQAMLQWAPGVMLGQEYVFPRFTLRVEGILDDSPNMSPIFVGRFPSGVTSSVPYAITYEDVDPFVRMRYPPMGVPIPTPHPSTTASNTMCALCGMHAAGQCASCDAPLCGKGCHETHLPIMKCIKPTYINGKRDRDENSTLTVLSVNAKDNANLKAFITKSRRTISQMRTLSRISWACLSIYVIGNLSTTPVNPRIYTGDWSLPNFNTYRYTHIFKNYLHFFLTHGTTMGPYQQIENMSDADALRFYYTTIQTILETSGVGLSHDIVLYRAYTPQKFATESLAQPIHMYRKNQRIVDWGFLSCSLDPREAVRVIGDKQCCLLKIHIKSGASILMITGFPDDPWGRDSLASKNQQAEVLLPAGSIFNVMSDEPRDAIIEAMDTIVPIHVSYVEIELTDKKPIKF